MIKIRDVFYIMVVVLLGVALGAQAKTPDGKPPSEETVCDQFTGSLFGLCNAYCEAMDCTDPNQHSSDTACERVKANFERLGGPSTLPCETSCPCFTSAQIDAAIGADGGATDCGANGTVFVMSTNELFFINSSEAACGEPEITGLSATEIRSCTDEILASASFTSCIAQ